MVKKKGMRYIGYTAVMPAHMQEEGKDGGTRCRGDCGKESAKLQSKDVGFGNRKRVK